MKIILVIFLTITIALLVRCLDRIEKLKKIIDNYEQAYVYETPIKMPKSVFATNLGITTNITASIFIYYKD